MIEWIINNLSWIIATWITYLNYRCIKKQREIQNDSFCYQLFDKRLKVYYAIKNCLEKTRSLGNELNALDQEFLQRTRDVHFLFGKDIQDKCDKIYNILSRLRNINQEILAIEAGLMPNDEHIQLLNEKEELQGKITNHLMNLPQNFQSYISFAKYQITPKDTIKTNKRINLLAYPSILPIRPVNNATQ